MFTLICARINGWVNNLEAGDLRRHRAHYDVIVMFHQIFYKIPWTPGVTKSNITELREIPWNYQIVIWNGIKVLWTSMEHSMKLWRRQIKYHRVPLNSMEFWNRHQCSANFHALQRRHNEHDGVSNHQSHDCLLNRLFKRRSKKTSKIRVTGLCVGIHRWPVNSPHKWPVKRKMFPFDDVMSMENSVECVCTTLVSKFEKTTFSRILDEKNTPFSTETAAFETRFFRNIS